MKPLATWVIERDFYNDGKSWEHAPNAFSFKTKALADERLVVLRSLWPLWKFRIRKYVPVPKISTRRLWVVERDYVRTEWRYFGHMPTRANAREAARMMNKQKSPYRYRVVKYVPGPS